MRSFLVDVQGNAVKRVPGFLPSLYRETGEIIDLVSGEACPTEETITGEDETNLPETEPTVADRRKWRGHHVR